mmetsp:Transcript_31989/g.36962  ORF Transcript_31989/g.36962 Transcript_31989/m.36962 type:complete len:92 (-) Transcript_31989:1670-1945(-)
MSVSKEVLARVAKQIFGTTPRHVRGKIDVDTPYVGAYLASYYQEPIENSVRKVIPGWTSELHDRRQIKLANLRRRGKGPPKKGQGKRSKKK